MAGAKRPGKFGHFLEMRQGGPHQKDRKKIFKCAECGGETHHEKGWDGEPDIGHCAAGCSSHSDWKPGDVSKQYRHNYDQIRWNSSKAGV